VKRLLIVLAVTLFGAVLAAVPSHANVTAAFCSGAGTSYCANRAGGGTANGTKVIAYNHDLENNNDFSVYGVTYCNGSGTVTATCPLSPASLNTPFIGDATVVIADNEGTCIGDSGIGFAILAGCGNSSGMGGGTGTIFIQYGDFYLNRYNTDKAGHQEWLYQNGYRNQLVLNKPNPVDSNGQWDPYFG
jgi:hypothetical protein